MTPYIIAIGALAWALAWARKRDQLAGDQTKTDTEPKTQDKKTSPKVQQSPKTHSPFAATHTPKTHSFIGHATQLNKQKQTTEIHENKEDDTT